MASCALGSVLGAGHRYNGTMTESRRRQILRSTPEQKAARAKLADARVNEFLRKKRTRDLIRLGGVRAHYGFETAEQVDELMAALSACRTWVEELRRRGVDLARLSCR